jgi:Membrane magnesium transporter
MMASNVLLVLGSFVLLHAAYSLQHYRSLIQNLEEAATGVSIDIEVTDSTVYQIPPLDVWIELAAAFVFLLIGEWTRTGSSLQPAAVKKGVKQKSLVAPPYVSRDFDIYTSRSRGFATGE